MNQNVPSEWTDETRVRAAEAVLLTEGPHGTKPTEKSYLTFATPGNWNLAALPVHNGYASLLPNFLESMLATVLDEDAYFSVNCMFRRGRRYANCPELDDILGPDGKRIFEAHRDNESISRLNACFVDLDCHKLGLTHGQVIGAIYDAARAGTIPTPSYLKDSGRGIWVFWLLGLEPRHYPEKVQLWNAIQTKLAAIFAPQGADSNAKDAARLTRVLGSNNTKVNRRVNMLVFGRDTSGKPIRYTLAELAKSLNIEPPRKRQREVAGFKNPKNQLKGIQGQAARWKKDEERFWLLCEVIRKAVPVGTRHAHNMVIGSILRHRWKHDRASLELAIDDAARRLWQLHPKSDNDYSREVIAKEILSIADGRKDGVKMAQQTMADLLAVTTAEAEEIRTMTVAKRGGTWPPATGQDPLPKTSLSRDEKRSLIHAILARHNNFPGMTDHAVADHITNDLGIPVSRETIRKARPPKPPPVPRLELPLS